MNSADVNVEGAEGHDSAIPQEVPVNKYYTSSLFDGYPASYAMWRLSDFGNVILEHNSFTPVVDGYDGYAKISLCHSDGTTQTVQCEVRNGDMLFNKFSWEHFKKSHLPKDAMELFLDEQQRISRRKKERPSIHRVGSLLLRMMPFFAGVLFMVYVFCTAGETIEFLALSVSNDVGDEQYPTSLEALAGFFFICSKILFLIVSFILWHISFKLVSKISKKKENPGKRIPVKVADRIVYSISELAALNGIKQVRNVSWYYSGDTPRMCRCLHPQKANTYGITFVGNRNGLLSTGFVFTKEDGISLQCYRCSAVTKSTSSPDTA